MLHVPCGAPVATRSGVNPTISKVDEKDEPAVTKELSRMKGFNEGHLHHGRVQFPEFFVGDKLFGGLRRVMVTHIYGELVGNM